jgi:hypothetical protein
MYKQRSIHASVKWQVTLAEDGLKSWEPQQCHLHSTERWEPSLETPCETVSKAEGASCETLAWCQGFRVQNDFSQRACACGFVACQWAYLCRFMCFLCFVSGWFLCVCLYLYVFTFVRVFMCVIICVRFLIVSGPLFFFSTED